LSVATAIVAVLLSSAAAQSRPSRIISLIPAVTEMLFAIGAGDRVVGVGSFDRFPPDVERIPRVGALLDPDLERILSLRPDLVIVYRSQTDLQTQLSRAQVPIFIYAHAGLADVTTTLRQLAERVGASERGQAVAGEIERRVTEVRRQAADRPHPKTLIVFGRDSFALRGIYASGGIGFVHDMVTAAGGQNVLADTKREAVQATTELIIARAPDVILELRADPIDAATESKELKTWGALSSVPAIRNGRVHIIADPRTVIPGPRVAEGVELLARALRGPR
jgi:iron complex transport system substrate-binding protein